MNDACHDVAVVGVDARTLARARIPDVVTLPDEDLSSAVFDEATHTWRLSSRRAWIVITDQNRCGPERLTPYLGVATHGVPNYFTVTGTGAVADAQVRYITECLKLMRLTATSRIEVRHSTQRTYHGRGMPVRATASFWRTMGKRVPSAFDMRSHADVEADVEADVYDGPADIRFGDDDRTVRVRLTGHLDPIDGRYHWQGTVFDALPAEVLRQSQPVTLTVGDRSAEGRVTERSSQGGCSVAGVGAPPYTLDKPILDVTLR